MLKNNKVQQGEASRITMELIQLSDTVLVS